jgi:hypothetical protein
LVANCNRVKVGDTVGTYDGNGYLDTRIGGKTYKLHRLAFLYMEGEFPPDQVDHINTVRSDNRWVNLRKYTQLENMNNPITKARWEESIMFYHKTESAQIHIKSISHLGGRMRWGNNSVLELPPTAQLANSLKDALVSEASNLTF